MYNRIIALSLCKSACGFAWVPPEGHGVLRALASSLKRQDQTAWLGVQMYEDKLP